MKKKDAFVLLYIVSGIVVVIGVGITLLGFVQSNGWIEKLVELDNLYVPGLALVIIGSVVGAWARKQVNKRN